MNRDKISYLFLFCSLMLVQKSAARLEEVISLLPSVGSARQLVERILTSQELGQASKMSSPRR